MKDVLVAFLAVFLYFMFVAAIVIALKQKNEQTMPGRLSFRSKVNAPWAPVVW